MIKRMIVIKILLLLIINNNIFGLINANNFVLQEKIDHDYVIGYLGHTAYDFPHPFKTGGYEDYFENISELKDWLDVHMYNDPEKYLLHGIGYFR